MSRLSEKILSSEKMKMINFICTSRSDFRELKKDKWRRAKIFNWIYLAVIFISILISFIPLFFLSDNLIMKQPMIMGINFWVLVVLVIDYILRWITYPVRVKGNSVNPMFFFLFTCSSFLMLLSIFSSVMFVVVSVTPSENQELLKLAKGLSILKIFRIILLLNIIPSFKMLTEIFIRNRIIVLNLMLVIVLMVFILALIIYSVEFGNNESIKNYGDALYYSFITVTTVGFGDIACKTNEGKFLSVILAFMGAVGLSIPFGIIVVAFNAKLRDRYKKFEEMDIVSTPAMVEQFYLKIFKSRKKKLSSQKIGIVLINYEKINEKDILYTKIKEIIGGEKNISKIFVNDDKHLEIHVINKSKISNELYIVSNLIDIKFISID